MLCSVLKSAKLSIFKGVQFSGPFEGPLRSLVWCVDILYLPEKTRQFIVVTMESELTNTYSLLSYLMSLITN